MPEQWEYVAACYGLTLVTLGAWWWMMLRRLAALRERSASDE
jgi:hypothetical protein